MSYTKPTLRPMRLDIDHAGCCWGPPFFPDGIAGYCRLPPLPVES